MVRLNLKAHESQYKFMYGNQRLLQLIVCKVAMHICSVGQRLHVAHEARGDVPGVKDGGDVHKSETM